MADTEIFNMPVEFDLDFVAVVGANFADPEWEFFDDVIYEIYGVGLRVLVIDFESANAGCVVDSGILEAPDLLSALSSTGQKFYIHLNMMTGNLLAIALGVDFPHPRSAWQSADAIAFEDASEN